MVGASIGSRDHDDDCRVEVAKAMKSEAMKSLKRESFHIANDEEHDLTILLQPWGHELSIAPGLGIEVIFEGEMGLSRNLSISRREHAVIVTVRQEGVAFFRMSAPQLVSELEPARAT